MFSQHRSNCCYEGSEWQSPLSTDSNSDSFIFLANRMRGAISFFGLEIIRREAALLNTSDARGGIGNEFGGSRLIYTGPVTSGEHLPRVTVVLKVSK
jgi:hypothetical protein